MHPLSSKRSENLNGTVHIPGDKSISHRAVMFGALAQGTTTITGLLEGEDVKNTAAAMTAMGASLKKQGEKWIITGTAGKLQQPQTPLDMGNSGTSTRLLMGLVSGYDIHVEFTGDASLSKRPMKRIITPLEQMGVGLSATSGGMLPLTVHGTSDLTPITYTLPMASAQVKSAVLLAGLQAQGKTTVIEPKPTRDHTERMLSAMGVNIITEQAEDGGQRITLHGQPQTPLMAQDIIVPSDPSSAAFPAAAAVLCPNSVLELHNINMNTTRTGLYQTLEEMGADIEFNNTRTQGGEPVTDIKIKSSALHGITVPRSRVPSMIDEFPILAVLAACATGTTHMTGLAELRVKESDRLATMATGLRQCGINLEEGEDSLTIHGTGLNTTNGHRPTGGTTIQTHLDHRIAMSFLILGLASENPITIDDGAPIKTSFPNFIDLMTEIGANIYPS